MRKNEGKETRLLRDKGERLDKEEKIALTDGLLTAVQSAHMHHRQRLDEKEAEKKR